MANPALVKHGQEQRERIMAFVHAFVASNGYSPSLHEIGAHIGVASVSATRNHLLRLQKDGRIRLQRGRPRGIEIVREGS